MQIRLWFLVLALALMMQGCGGGKAEDQEPPSQAELQRLASGASSELGHLEQLRQTCICPECDLSNADLANFRPAEDKKFAMRKVGQNFVQTICDLQHANLSGANMSNSNLSASTTNYCTVAEELGCDSNVVATRFQLANMKGVNLSHAWLINVTFNQANMQGADLSNCDVTRSQFANTDLTGANMENIKAFEDEVLGLQADFRYAKMEKANLKNAYIIALFTYADFRGADLEGAFLNADPTVSGGLLPWQRVNFSETNLKGAMIGLVKKEGKHVPGISKEVIKESILCKTIMPDGRVENRDCLRAPPEAQPTETPEANADKKNSEKPSSTKEDKKDDKQPDAKKP